MKHFLFAAAVILIGAFSRLLPHPPNVTPIAAIALVGAAYLDRRYALLLPVAALLLSDIVLGLHGTMVYVYASFGLIAMMGFWVRRKRSVGRIASATVGGSVLFYLVTNFGVWIGGDGIVYPKTFEGLVECYVAAIPFFRNSLIGDAAYATLFFGVFELARRTHGLFETEPAATAGR